MCPLLIPINPFLLHKLIAIFSLTLILQTSAAFHYCSSLPCFLKNQYTSHHHHHSARICSSTPRASCAVQLLVNMFHMALVRYRFSTPCPCAQLPFTLSTPNSRLTTINLFKICIDHDIGGPHIRASVLWPLSFKFGMGSTICTF